jgi:hypothetical protein
MASLSVIEGCRQWCTASGTGFPGGETSANLR